MRILLISMVFVLTGCVNQTSSNLTEVKAEVIQFYPDSCNMDYTDGGWETFDVVDLNIISPKMNAGEIVSVIIHPQTMNTFFHTTNTQCSFYIQQDILATHTAHHTALFEGALQDLKQIK